MNYKRWAHSEPIPYETRLAKIVEEVGEVASELLKYRRAAESTNPGKRGIKMRRDNLREELSHVEFQAAQLRLAIASDEWK